MSKWIACLSSDRRVICLIDSPIFRPFGIEARLARSKVACVALKWRLVTIDESKHYLTNQYHPEHYSIYPKAGKCTLVCSKLSITTIS